MQYVVLNVKSTITYYVFDLDKHTKEWPMFSTTGCSLLDTFQNTSASAKLL